MGKLPDRRSHFTLDQVVERTGVKKQTLRDWIKKGKMKAFQPAGKGGMFFIPKTEFK